MNLKSAASFFCLLLVGIVFGWFLVDSYHEINYPFLINLGEPALAQSIAMMKQGILPYRELQTPPFILTPYGPVYPVLSILLKSVFSGVFVAGRVLTFCASLSVCAGIFLYARQVTGNIRVPALLSCSFILMPIIQKWAVQVNVDMTAVALEMTAFFLLSTQVKKNKVSAYLFLGILFQTLAFFTKSSAISAGAAYALLMLLTRRWRPFMIYTVIQASALLTVFVFMNILTDGQYYFHTVYEIGHRTVFKQFIPVFWSEMLTENRFWAAAILLCIVSFIHRREVSICAIAFVVSAFLTLSLSKQGSDTNYFLSFLMYGSFFISRYFPKIPFLKLAASVLILIHVGVYMPKSADAFRYPEKYTECIEFYSRFSKLVRDAKGPIISWDMSLLLANGKPVYFEPFPMAQMAYSGVWDETPITEAIESRKIPLMILYFASPFLKGDRNFSPGFISALRQHYQIIGRVKTPWDGTPYWFLYVPKGGAVKQV